MPGTQRRVACPHLEADHYVALRCYTSEVSSSNLSTFVRSGHVHGDVELSDLRTWLGQADDADAVLVVCNACDRVLQVDGGEVVVRHRGEEEREDPPIRADGGEEDPVRDYFVDPAEGTELYFWAEEGRVSQPTHSNIQALFSPDGRYRLTVEVGESDGVAFPGYRIQLHRGAGDGTFLHRDRQQLADVLVPQHLAAEVADYLARRVGVLEDLNNRGRDAVADNGGDA